VSQNIHPTAIVSLTASIGKDVKIGPYSYIGPEVKLGDNVYLKSHVVIEGITSVGENTTIYPFASIGQAPQILKYAGEKSEVVIGANNVIREYVTIQAGSTDGGMITYLGDNCLLMVGAHVGHDCKIGNNVILANYVNLGGHVDIGDFVIIGGLTAVHQYVRIGPYAMIGGASAVARDLIPFGLANNERAVLEGINLIGMKRRGFDKQESLNASKAVEEIFNSEGILADRINQASNKYSGNKIVEQIIEFLKQDTTRAFCAPKK
jgi:UDP-N-acetylglucosamine acyltransferase